VPLGQGSERRAIAIEVRLDQGLVGG